jgi:hypothetical protein
MKNLIWLSLAMVLIAVSLYLAATGRPPLSPPRLPRAHEVPQDPDVRYQGQPYRYWRARVLDPTDFVLRRAAETNLPAIRPSA